MKKFLTVTAVILAIGIVLVGISSVALHLLMPPEKAKALVLRQLTSRLHREVRLGGVSVGLVSGLSLSDLQVSEAPDFSKGTFISSDHFSLKVALVPLLFRKIVVRQLVLKHPVVSVVRYADGKTFNFSDLTAPSTAPVTTAGQTPTASETSNEPPFLLLVSRAVISQGTLHFTDHSTSGRSMDIDPLDLTLSNMSLVSPFTVHASMRVKSQGAEIGVDLSAEANLLDGSAKIKTGNLTSAGTRLSLTGRATNLRAGKPNADLTLDIKELDLAALRPFLSLPPALRTAGPLTGIVRVKGIQSAMDFSTMLDLTKADVVYGPSFHKPAKTAFQLKAVGTVSDLESAKLNALDLALGEIHLAAHGTVRGVASPQPSAALHFETNSFRAEELLRFAPQALPKNIALSGATKIAADISGTLVSSHINLKWEAKDLGISWPGLFLKSAGVPLELEASGEALNQERFNFDNFSATLASMQLKGGGSYNTAGKGAMEVSCKSNLWRLQDLAPLLPALNVYKPAGTASFEGHASGAPASPVTSGAVSFQEVSAHYEQSILTRVSGTMTFTAEDVVTPKISGQLNGSEFSVKLTGHRLSVQPDITVEANIATLDLDKLLPPLVSTATASSGNFAPAQNWAWVAPLYAAEPAAASFKPLKLNAHVVAGRIKHEFYQAQNLDFKCNLSDLTPDLDKVSGTSNLRQGAGKLLNVEKLASASKLARIALAPINILQKLEKKGILKNAPSLQSIPFDSLKGDYLLRMGQMEIQTFDLIGKDLSLSTKGTVGLAGAQPINLKIVMHPAQGLVGGSLGQWMQDENGKPVLHFTATGTAANPQVHWDDLETIGRKAAQQFGSQLLKGLGIGQPQAPPPSNAAPSDNQAAPAQQNPVDDLQKSLNKIFHR